MELFFHRVYEMADLVATTVENDGGEFGLFEELDWSSPGVKGCLSRFSKTSLLAHCCFAIIRIYHLRAYRKDSEAFDEDHIQLTEEALGRYAIPFVSFRDFMIARFPPKDVGGLGPSISIEAHSEAELTAALAAAVESGKKIVVHRRESEYVVTDRPDPDPDDALNLWLREHEDTFSHLWEKMADEVFHLLFGNRSILLIFNSALAQFRRTRGDDPTPRCKIPQWVKRAVYFRENGKCALCRKDLSGLIAFDVRQHYDHIVPLKSLGANDPCNIQLLCLGCNLAKGAAQARTSSMYEPWWQ